MLTPAFSPETRSEYIAQQLAEQLQSPDSLPYFLILTREYESDFLFQILSQVKQVPEEKIKKSRAALFVWSVRHYGTAHRYAPPPNNLPVADGCTAKQEQVYTPNHSQTVEQQEEFG